MSLEEFLNREIDLKLFQPTRYQRLLLEQLQQIRDGERPKKVLDYRRTTQVNDEFTCAHLLEMKQGQRFALVSPGEIRIFELVEIEEV